MKIIICLSTALLFGCLLLGCGNTCCDCEENQFYNEQGNLRIIRNWDKLWEGLSKPETLDVYFYSQVQALQHQKIYSDTTYLFLGNGEYNVLAFNDIANISNLEDYDKARISISRRKIGNKYFTSEAPMTIGTSANVYVDDFKTSDLTLTPIPIVSIINFRFIILKDSIAGNITECRAELNGVLTSRLLSRKIDSENISATLPFITNKTAEGIFDKRISTLGLSGKDNTLDVAIDCENGQSKNVTIDLTNLFEFSLSPIQNCIIQLRINENMSAAVIDTILIEDWSEGTSDDIEFQ